jgi:phenylpropionate dioxygenase-like ring-hydroxylating dioxygenase large terminal subunit
MFARNHWYVAALSSELTSKPLGRRILGDPVVLYRTSSGRAVAFEDRCPHRRFPLSLGFVEADELVCNYHGFTFDTQGTCIRVPGQKHAPSRANLRRYPLVEQGVWTWIWMGDPDRPDHSKLPDTPYLVSGGDWDVLTGMAPLKARYELLVDNLLDLSHEAYLHATHIGTSEVAETPIDVDLDEDNRVVRVFRHIENAAPSPASQRFHGNQMIDRWQDIEYYPPGFYLLHTRFAPTGVQPAPDGTDDQAMHGKICYGITPSTETTTYNFWSWSRDYERGDAETDAYIMKVQDEVVQQDVVALDALEEAVAADPNSFEVNVRNDRGGLAARRMLERMIADEQASAQPVSK